MNKIFFAVTVSLLLVSFGNYAFAQYDDKLVVLETNLGNITIDFFPNDAPNHVDNFIGLAESGFYDGVLFHRIIPGFMIQGGDPNTKTDNKNSWGMGGPDKNINQEFNTIKHNRGIVSMARTQDVNGAGSQFFIVHNNSNELDGAYTVFGRIATQESFDTLDKIAAVETEPINRPIDIDDVRIISTKIISSSELTLLEWKEPERMNTNIENSEFIPYENSEFGFIISLPNGWQIQEPSKSQTNAPDISIVGGKEGIIPPTFSITIEENSEKTFEEKINDIQELIQVSSEQKNMIDVVQNKELIGKYDAYVIEGIVPWKQNGGIFPLQFKEVIISTGNDFYTINYYNDKNYFNNHLKTFETSLNSFKLQSEIGGCLIATATFGSELSSQVQQLRELRDNELLQTQVGQSFMSSFNEFYYSFSPYIADYERENSTFKEVVKITLTLLLTSLSILNYVSMDSEESVLGYGISLILLNVGMYFVAPTIIIMRIRKQLV